MKTYADSSFIVSYYVQDLHSIETDRRMGLFPSVWMTPFHRTEVAHVLHQYVFRGVMANSETQAAWLDFEQDCAEGIWVPVDLPEKTWATSIDLARLHGASQHMRTLDSLHVACALELRADKFWTFDERQARLAQSVGLDTDS